MRKEIYFCDTCNADLTDRVEQYGKWQRLSASGTLEGADFAFLDVDACSLECLIAAIESVRAQV